MPFGFVKRYTTTPASKTLGRRCLSIIQMFCVYWDSCTPGAALLVDTAGRYWV